MRTARRGNWRTLTASGRRSRRTTFSCWARATIIGCTISSARSSGRWTGSRACPSPSGPRRPAACRWSVISTCGMAAPTRCAPWAPPASGRSSCRGSPSAPATSSSSWARTTALRSSRRTPTASISSLRPTTRPSSATSPASSGTTPCGWSPGDAATRGRARCPSTRCTWPPGAASRRRAGASSGTANWANSSPPIASNWGSRTWN